MKTIDHLRYCTHGEVKGIGASEMTIFNNGILITSLLNHQERDHQVATPV